VKRNAISLATPFSIFQSLKVGGGVALWDKLAYRSTVVKIATLYEFDENDRFFTTSCDPNMGYTLRLFFTHFTTKRRQRMTFKKNA
jgi:hypothetical protein